MGNILIAGFSWVLYLIEYKVNDSINSLLDAIWWGFATATTVGYGDIIPVTVYGRILGILLMLTGTALFSLYTGLFANIFFEERTSR